MPHEFCLVIKYWRYSLNPSVQRKAYSVERTLGDFSQFFQEFLSHGIRVCSSEINRVYRSSFVKTTDIFYDDCGSLIRQAIGDQINSVHSVIFVCLDQSFHCVCRRSTGQFVNPFASNTDGARCTSY